MQRISCKPQVRLDKVCGLEKLRTARLMLLEPPEVLIVDNERQTERSLFIISDTLFSSFFLLNFPHPDAIHVLVMEP